MDPSPSESRRPPPPRPFPWAVLILTAILAWWVGTRLLGPSGPLHDPGATSRTVTPRGALAEYERLAIDLYRAASPSVVHVQNLALTPTHPWSLDLQEVPRGEGTGFVWDARGYVVTNFHVVENGDRFAVILADGTSVSARLVGTAPDNDVAVLKLDGVAPERIPALALGTSNDLQVGQAVFAIGNPFGLDQTITSGIISGLGREIRARTGRRIQGVIQTDAAINPGNSGGPLLDSAGRVVGVNTAILSPSGAYSGVGFAVPIDTVNGVVPRILKGERPERPGLGVRLVDPRFLRRYGVEGAAVLEVDEGSAAAAAGLRSARRDAFTGDALVSDLIVAVDGKPVRSNTDLLDALDEHAVGDVVTLTVRRGREVLEIPVSLQALR